MISLKTRPFFGVGIELFNMRWSRESEWFLPLLNTLLAWYWTWCFLLLMVLLMRVNIRDSMIAKTQQFAPSVAWWMLRLSNDLAHGPYENFQRFVPKLPLEFHSRTSASPFSGEIGLFTIFPAVLSLLMLKLHKKTLDMSIALWVHYSLLWKSMKPPVAQHQILYVEVVAPLQQKFYKCLCLGFTLWRILSLLYRLMLCVAKANAKCKLGNKSRTL